MARVDYQTPALVWRYPARTRDAESRHALPDSEDGVGEPFGAVPTPAQVDTLGLRAWFHCATCDRHRPQPKGCGGASYCGGTGYGYDSTTGRAVCYDCCAVQDRAQLERDGRGTLYLTRKPDAQPAPTVGTYGRGPLGRPSDWQVSNWPASLTLPVVGIKRSGHNWRNVERVDFWFILAGHVWHGARIGDMDCARVKRTRAEWREGPHGYYAHTPRKSRAKVARN